LCPSSDALIRRRWSDSDPSRVIWPCQESTGEGQIFRTEALHLCVAVIPNNLQSIQ